MRVRVLICQSLRFYWITLELWICCIALQFRQKYYLQFFNYHILKEEKWYNFYINWKLNFWIFNDSLEWMFYCFVLFFHWILRTIDKKKVYKNLIKELIKLFDGHILLYILQSLSSMFANIEMCFVHRRNIDIVYSSV